jgi:hypothetical protein
MSYLLLVKLKRRKRTKKCRKVKLSLRFPYKNIRNFLFLYSSFWAEMSSFIISSLDIFQREKRLSYNNGLIIIER